MPVDKTQTYTITLKDYDIDGNGIADEFSTVLYYIAPPKSPTDADRKKSSYFDRTQIVDFYAKLNKKDGSTKHLDKKALQKEKYGFVKLYDNDTLEFSADFVSDKSIAGGIAPDGIKERNYLAFTILKGEEIGTSVRINQYAHFKENSPAGQVLKEPLGKQRDILLINYDQQNKKSINIVSHLSDKPEFSEYLIYTQRHIKQDK
ncbi:MAG: hypothetical protein V4691_04600 [Pseudomonadota bacterium]